MTKEEILITAQLIGLGQLVMKGEISINQARDAMGIKPLDLPTEFQESKPGEIV